MADRRPEPLQHVRLEGVARVEMVAAAAERDEARRDACVRQELDAFDETEAAARLEPAGQHGRDREEELVDEASREQRTEGRRACFGEDVLVPARAKQLQRASEIDPV